MKPEFSKWAGGSARHILDVSVDLWSDPSDVRLTKINAGREGRMEDIRRIGGDIRKAASEVLPERKAGRG